MTLEVWQLILAGAGALGIGGIIKAGYDHWLKRQERTALLNKTDADTEAIELENRGKELDLIDKAIDKSEKLLEKTQTNAELIQQLKEEKYADRLRIERRDGIVAYQKDEIKDLHTEIRDIHAKVVKLTDEVAKLTERISDVTRLNLQLQGTLDHLKEEGVWDGVLKGL